MDWTDCGFGPPSRLMDFLQMSPQSPQLCKCSEVQMFGCSHTDTEGFVCSSRRHSRTWRSINTAESLKNQTCGLGADSEAGGQIGSGSFHVKDEEDERLGCHCIQKSRMRAWREKERGIIQNLFRSPPVSLQFSVIWPTQVAVLLFLDQPAAPLCLCLWRDDNSTPAH